jgi:hypothetical protein
MLGVGVAQSPYTTADSVAAWPFVHEQQSAAAAELPIAGTW